MLGDRERWDARYLGQAPAEPLSSHWLEQSMTLPASGSVLEVACGRGALACYLAARGLTVTALDVSYAALKLTRELAAAQGLSVRTVLCDLDEQGLPEGPYTLITCMHFLLRPLLVDVASRLELHGLCAFEIATETNLERNAHPSARFLVKRGELERTLAGQPNLEIVYAREDWFAEQHCARVIARRRS